jgi:hypothetical protein
VQAGGVTEPDQILQSLAESAIDIFDLIKRGSRPRRRISPANQVAHRLPPRCKRRYSGAFRIAPDHALRKLFAFPKCSVAEFRSNDRLMPRAPHVGPYDSYYRHARLFFSPYLLINQPRAVGGQSKNPLL